MATRRLLCIKAHPDDESLGVGGVLARYAAEGVATYLLTATRGERGWQGPPADNPGQTALGRLREAELHAAARVLGVRETRLLDYIDGDLDQVEPSVILPAIVSYVRRVRPQVVITFAPDGAYGHPDHIAISQLTMAALVAAADAAFADSEQQAPHRVSKLYYFVVSQPYVTLLHELFGGPLAMQIDGVPRQLVAWPDWAITTRIDARDYWPTVWAAVQCHRSQLPSLGSVVTASDDVQVQVWGEGTFYRAYSMVNHGREVERDLFAGLD